MSQRAPGRMDGSFICEVPYRVVQIANSGSAPSPAPCGFQRIRECGDLFFASPSPSGRGWREAPGEGSNAETLGIPALIRPFLDARPIGLALRAGHLLPKGEGLACGFPRSFWTALPRRRCKVLLGEY